MINLVVVVVQFYPLSLCDFEVFRRARYLDGGDDGVSECLRRFREIRLVKSFGCDGARRAGKRRNYQFVRWKVSFEFFNYKRDC